MYPIQTQSFFSSLIPSFPPIISSSSFSKNPFSKNPYGKNQFSKNSYGKNPFSKNQFSKNPFSENQFSKNPFPKNQFSKNPFSKNQFSKNPFGKNPYGKNCAIKSSVVCVDDTDSKVVVKPEAAEVARTIMELSSVGTLSALTEDGWPVSIGVRFAVDGSDGTPVLCCSNTHKYLAVRRDGTNSSFHVQLEQSGGVRTPQCTIQGTLIKPQQHEDPFLLKKLHSIWEEKFVEAVNEDFIYTISVDRVIQMDDFMEDGILVTSSDYKAASPDPLRDFAERIVDEINTHNKEDVHRFCNIYIDTDFMVKEANMVWVDRLGFDMRLRSVENDTFEVRIPFPREVTDEKGVKSSFNGMSQLAWEVEKNYYAPDFNKVKHLKKISSRGD